MQKFQALLKHECLKLYQAKQIHYSLFWTLLISSIALPLVCAHDEISSIAPLFIISYLPGIILNLSSNIFRRDKETGALDFSLINHSALSLVLAKFIGLAGVAAAILVLCLPLLAIIYSLNSWAVLLFCTIIIATQSASLALLISSIECYFAKTSLLFASLSLPFTIPLLITCGLILHTYNHNLLLIILGILIITGTIALALSNYLIRNI